MGSQQWRLLRRALRDGKSLEEAAAIGGQSLTEARLLAEIDERNSPLPEEAFELLHDPDAPAAASTMERASTMADDDTTSEEVKVMDFERAKRLYFHDIRPAKSEASSQGQAVAEAMKVIKKECYIEPQGAKAAFKAFDMEEAHRETHIRSFVGMFNALIGAEVLTANFGDLVDMMQSMPTLGDDDDDADLSEQWEASEEELARQEGRRADNDELRDEEPAGEEKPKRIRRTARPKEEEPAAGTGAAAIKAMQESASAEGATAH